MSTMTHKDIAINIIKSKGDCPDNEAYACNDCPFTSKCGVELARFPYKHLDIFEYNEHCTKYVNPINYKMAVEYIINNYGRKELIKCLL